MRCVSAVIVTAVAVTGVAAQRAADVDVSPPRLVAGSPVLPSMPPPTVIGLGEVFLAVSTGPAGRITGIRDLRTTPPYDGFVRPAVEQWSFVPAIAGGEAVEGHVLVAAVYRPHVLYDNPTAGTPARDVAARPEGIPYPIHRPLPAYPPNVIGDNRVVIEVLVDASGQVAGAAVVSPRTGFDTSALQAAVAWRFDPARYEGAAVEAYAYLIFGFREPVAVF